MSRLPRATAVHPDPAPHDRFSGVNPHGLFCTASNGAALCTRNDLHIDGEHHDFLMRVTW